jgi:hypothetical protein
MASKAPKPRAKAKAKTGALAAPDPLAALRRRVAKKLEGFTADFPEDVDRWAMSRGRPDAAEFPVPELVLFLFRNLMGWRWSGHGEKVRWSVYGSVNGEPVGFELRKFGFTILRAEDAKVPTARIVGQLKTALKEVEAFLEPYAEAQVETGDVLIVNRFSEFGSRYRFFRQRAEKAYATAAKPPRPKRPKKAKKGKKSKKLDLIEINFGLADLMNHTWGANRKGFFHSTAMVDAYFSALEHRLVLLRAFTGAALAPGELTQFLAAKWDDKLKTVLPMGGNRKAELLLGKMRRIKERIRNPFAHGGVENDKGSLFFHLPTVGAIPANFSRFGDSIRFSVMPIEADDHAECCAAFDEMDHLLSVGPLAGAHRLMDAGVDPSFDTDTLAQYAKAIAGSKEELEGFIDDWSHNWERHANMDY